MKRILALILALVMTMALVACGGDKPTSTPSNPGTSAPGTVPDINNPVIPSNPSTPAENVTYEKNLVVSTSAIILDPNLTWSSAREFYNQMVFDTLIHRSDVTGEVEMRLAKTVEWANDECSRIHVVLNENAVFSNGDKVTSADVEFSLGRCGYGSMKSHYDSCDIVSDTELYINLKGPNAAFMPILSRSCCGIVSKAAAEKDPDGQALIGSGAWKYDMSTYVANSTITLVRNEKYWGEYENPTETVRVVQMTDASARAIALQSGEIHLAFDLNSTEIPQIKKNDKLVVNEFASLSFVFVGFNDHRNTDALTEEEINLRRAVACAIKKEDVMIAAGDEGGQAMVSMLSLAEKAYIGNEADYDDDLSYNPEKAKEYLAKAGGKNELTCLILSDKAVSKTAGQVIQEYCRQVGITINFMEVDSTGFTALVKTDNPEYDMFVWTNLFATEVGYWNYFLTTSTVNRALINSSVINAAIDQLKRSSDEAVRNEQLQIIQKEVHKNVSYIPLYWSTKNIAYAKGLEGFEVSAMPTYDINNIRLRTN